MYDDIDYLVIKLISLKLSDENGHHFEPRSPHPLSEREATPCHHLVPKSFTYSLSRQTSQTNGEQKCHSKMQSIKSVDENGGHHRKRGVSTLHKIPKHSCSRKRHTQDDRQDNRCQHQRKHHIKAKSHNQHGRQDAHSHIEFGENPLKKNARKKTLGWYQGTVVQILSPGSDGRVRAVLQLNWQKELVAHRIFTELNDITKLKRCYTCCHDRVAFMEVKDPSGEGFGHLWVRIHCDPEQVSESNELLVKLVDYGTETYLPLWQTFVCPPDLASLPVSTAEVSFPPDFQPKLQQNVIVGASHDPLTTTDFVAVDVWNFKAGRRRGRSFCSRGQ